MLKIYLHNVLSFQITFLCSVSKRPLKLSLYMNHKVWTNTLNKTTENVISCIQSKWKKIVTITEKKFLCNHFTVTLKIRLGHLLFHIILFITGKKKKEGKKFISKKYHLFPFVNFIFDRI